MTPLAAAPPPMAPGQAGASGRSGMGREAPQTSFAQVLEQGRSGPPGDAEGAGAHPGLDPKAGGGQPGADPRPDGSEPTEDPALPDPGGPAWAAAAQPVPAWPPAGLSALHLPGTGGGLQGAAPTAAPVRPGLRQAGTGTDTGMGMGIGTGVASVAIDSTGMPSLPVDPAAPLDRATTMQSHPISAGVAAALPAQPALPPASAAGSADIANALIGSAPADTTAGPGPGSGSGAAAAMEGIEPPPSFALPALAGSPPAAAARESVPMLAPPPGTPTPDLRGQDFGERFGAQLHWMADQKLGHARIRVSPQELGPVEVRLSLDGDRISADFISVHAETRQALEQGLPRLRELLGEHGFHLAHADVGSQGSSPGRDGETGSQSGGTPATGGDGEAPAARPEAASHRISRGLLDAYA